MIINSQTTIGSLIRHNPEVIDAIAELSPRFSKLRNPVLRKLMAARTTLAMAAKVGGCKVEDLVNRILPLGFEYSGKKEEVKRDEIRAPWALGFDEVLDVRPILSKGNDPLKEILKVVGNLGGGKVLKLVNSFEPVPLIRLLERQGYETSVHSHVASIDTYIRLKGPVKENNNSTGDYSFEHFFDNYREALIEIDVREMEMPRPMMTILKSIENLDPGKALWVHHKKVPVYLLPELKERGFLCSIKETPGDIQLLIFREGE